MDVAESYQILEVSETASATDVRLAYRQLAQVWHPDRFAFDPVLFALDRDRLVSVDRQGYWEAWPLKAFLATPSQ